MQLPNPNYRHQNNPQQPNLVQAPQQSGSQQQQQQQPPYQMNQPSPPIPSAGAPPAFPGGPPLPPTSSINQNQSVMNLNSSANYQQQALNAPAYQPATPSPGKGFPQQQSFSQTQAQQFVQPLPQVQPPPPWTPNYQQQERQVLYNQQQQPFPSSDQSVPKEFHSQQSTAPPPPHHTTRGGRSNSIVPGHGLPAHDYGIQQQQQLQPRAPPPPWTPPSSSAFAGRRLYDQSNPHQGEQLQQQQGNSSQQQHQQPHQTAPSLNPSYPTAPTIGAAGTQTSSSGGGGPVPATNATTSSILQSEQSIGSAAQPPPPTAVTSVGGSGGGSGSAVTVGLPHGGGLAPGSWLQSQQPSLPTQQTPTSGGAILLAQESGRASSSQQSGKQQANKGRGSTHKVSVASRKTARQQQPPTPTGEESSESELPASPLISLIPTQAGGGGSSKTPAKTTSINTTAMLRPAPVLIDGILDRSMIILVKRKPKEEGHHHPPPSSGGHLSGRRRVSSHDGSKGRSGTTTTTTSTATPPQTRSPSAPLQETLTPAQLLYLLDGTLLKGKGRMGGEGRSLRSLIQDVIVLSPATDMKLRTQLVLADLVEEGTSQSEKEVIATNTDLAIGLVIFNEERDAKQVCTPTEEEEEEATAITPTTPDLLFEGSSTKERSSKVFHSSVIDEEVLAVFRALSNNPQHQELLQNLSKLFSYPYTPTTASSTALSTVLANCLGEDLGSNEQAVLRQIEAGEVDRRTLWEQQPVEYLKGSFLPQEGQTADEVRMILDPTLPALKDRDMATRCQVWEESKGKECPVTWKQEECPFRHIVKKETFKRLPFTVCKFSARGIPCKMSGCEFFHGTKEQLEMERSRKLTAQEVRSLGFPVPPLPAHFLEMGSRPRPEQYFYRPGLYMLLDHPLVNYPNTISRQDRFLDLLRSCPPFVPRAMLGWQTRWSSSSSAKPTAERQYSNNSAMASVSSIVSVAGVGASSHAGGSSATGSSAAFGGGVGVHHTHPVSPQQHSSLGQPPSLQDSPSILQQPHQRSPPLQRVMSVGGGASGPQLQPNQMQQVDHPAELAPSSLFSPPLPRVGGDEEDSQSSSSSVNNPPRAGDSAASTEGEQQHSRRPPLKKSTTYTHSPYALTSHLLVGRTEQSQQSGGGGAGSSSVSSSASVSSSSVVQGDQAVGYPQRPASAPARGRGGGGSSGSSLTVLARPPSSTSGGTTRTSDEYSGFSSQEEEEEEEE